LGFGSGPGEVGHDGYDLEEPPWPGARRFHAYHALQASGCG
jgi:hypothetical protein